MKNFIFPKGTVILTNEEQEKRICGVAHVEMNPLYLAKSACEVKAAQLIATKQVTRMSVLGIAQEIFAHACAYYASSTIIALGVDSSKVNEIKSRANPVDIADGGDSANRKAIYSLIWQVTPSILPQI